MKSAVFIVIPGDDHYSTMLAVHKPGATYSLPGGPVETGETSRQAILRHVRAYSPGITLDVSTMIPVYYDIVDNVSTLTFIAIDFSVDKNGSCKWIDQQFLYKLNRYSNAYNQGVLMALNSMPRMPINKMRKSGKKASYGFDNDPYLDTQTIAEVRLGAPTLNEWGAYNVRDFMVADPQPHNIPVQVPGNWALDNSREE